MFDQNSDNYTRYSSAQNRFAFSSFAPEDSGTYLGVYKSYVDSKTITVADIKAIKIKEKEVSSITVTPPTKNTYVAGESLDLTGGVVNITYSNNTTGTQAITSSMVSGFDSTTGGLSTVTVTLGGKTATFDTLIVEAPAPVTATYGQTLGDVPLPANWSWVDNSIVPTVGNSGYQAVYTPTDSKNYNSITGINVTVKVNKATPTYTVPTGLTAIEGQNLADVELPNNFTWEDALTTNVGTVGTHTFKVTYTPDDTENYHIVTNIDVTLTVSAETPEEQDDVADFVTRLYENILQRKPDAAGLSAWTEVLKLGQEEGAKVALGFIQSPEFVERGLSNGDYVKILYTTLLGREADGAGYDAWVALLDDGMSRLYVFRGFAESMEFYDICEVYGIIRGNVPLTRPQDQNEGVTKFVVRCYRLCLNRELCEEYGIR